MLFGAHADDIELQAAGTLLRLQERGYEAVYVMVTDNSSGALLDEDGAVMFRGPAETQGVRHAETRAAATLLGVDPVHLHFKQRHFHDPVTDSRVVVGSDEYKLRSLSTSREPIVIASTVPACVTDVADLIAVYEPEFVLTHTLDVDPEHRSTCDLVYQAFKEAAERVELGSLYAWGPSSAGEIIPVEPDTLIDISPYMEAKVEAFLKHRSQATEDRKRRIRRRAEAWGAKLGVEHAEAFRAIIRGTSRLEDV